MAAVGLSSVLGPAVLWYAAGQALAAVGPDDQAALPVGAAAGFVGERGADLVAGRGGRPAGGGRHGGGRAG